MKIYTRVVIDSITGQTVDEEFFNYDGPLCEAKNSPSPPSSPDYTGAATATAAGNLEAAQQAQQANMVNQNTPYGSLNYVQSGYFPSGNPQYSSNISLSPTGQKLLDYANNSAIGLGKEQDQALQRTDQALAQPFDQSSVPAIADQSYSAQTARLDPQWDAASKQNDTALANQGLAPGGEAYDNAKRTFNQGKNDAYTQARLAAISTMPQTYQLASAARNQPLNELNALRTGSQVQNPSFTSTPQQQTTTGPNYLGAAQAQGTYDQGLYNAQVGQTNSMNSGLMSAAAAAAMFF